MRTIFASIRRRAGIPASNRQARCGAVAFIQRFSDALNLDPHFHVLVLDGIYGMDGKREPAFRRVSPPTGKEVAHVAERIHRRVQGSHHPVQQNADWGARKPLSLHITRYQRPGGKALLSRTKNDTAACPSYPSRQMLPRWSRFSAATG